MSGKRGLLIAAGVVIGLALTTVIAWRVVGSRKAPGPAPQIPASVRAKLSITLYYPQNLPAGLSVQSQTFKNPQKDVLVFGIDDGGRQIAVSEQPKPSVGFDLNSFYTNNVSNSSQFLTGEGQATQGQLSNGRQFGSLITIGGTWLIVTAPPQVKAEDIHAVLSAMQAYRG